jgi:hyperosmotically inducible periplasmic protein
MRAVLGALLVVLILILAVVVFGMWTGGSRAARPATVGTSGTVDTERARERGAELGEKAAAATQKIEETAHEAALTTKIKAKMALDDTVRARSIDVTTSGSVVTVSGTVRSAAERERAVALARETAGVSQVVNHLEVRP